MVNLHIIHICVIDGNKKYHIGAQAKQPRKSLHTIIRDSKILQLVHLDNYKFNGMLTCNHK